MSGIMVARKAGDFVPHPVGGPFPAVLSDIRLHEQVQTSFGVKDRLQLVFQTSEMAREHIDMVDDDRPMTISVFVNRTLNDKSRLYEILTQQVSVQDLMQKLKESKGQIDIENQLVGTQWLLSVTHNSDNGTTYSNVASLMKAPPEQNLATWREGGPE
jgi:hypothetical protein